MTAKEASQILFAYMGYLKFNDCGPCEEKICTALSMGSNALTVLEQYKRERDLAISQLDDLGVEFGRKTNGVYLSKDEYEELVEYKNMYEGLTK